MMWCYLKKELMSTINYCNKILITHFDVSLPSESDWRRELISEIVSFCLFARQVLVKDCNPEASLCWGWPTKASLRFSTRIVCFLPGSFFYDGPILVPFYKESNFSLH